VFRHAFAGVKKIEMRFSHVRRWNSLHRCVRAVRDCFPAGRSCGFPVCANDGTKADLCFKRQGKSAEKTKAVFPQGNAESCVEKEAKQVKHKMEDMGKIGLHVQSSGDMSVSYKDLFAFERASVETTFNVSFRAWDSLTSPMLADQEVDEMTILDILRRKQSTMRPMGPHRGVISKKPLQQFLRETR
jgi:hypothetical protein